MIPIDTYCELKRTSDKKPLQHLANSPPLKAKVVNVDVLLIGFDIIDGILRLIVIFPSILFILKMLCFRDIYF